MILGSTMKMSSGMPKSLNFVSLREDSSVIPLILLIKLQPFSAHLFTHENPSWRILLYFSRPRTFTHKCVRASPLRLRIASVINPERYAKKAPFHFPHNTSHQKKRKTLQLVTPKPFLCQRFNFSQPWTFVDNEYSWKKIEAPKILRYRLSCFRPRSVMI